MSLPIPTSEAVGTALIKNLFPATTASTAITFAKNLTDGVDSVWAEHSTLVTRNASAIDGSVFDGLVTVAKKVALAAGDAMWQEAKKYLTNAANEALMLQQAQKARKTNTPTRGLKAAQASPITVDAAKISQLSDNLKACIPMLVQLSAAAVPGDEPSFKKGKVASPALGEVDKQLYLQSLAHVTQSTCLGFISKAEEYLAANPVSASDLTEDDDMVDDSARENSKKRKSLSAAPLGSFWDSLKSIAGNVAQAAAGAIPIIAPVILDRLSQPKVAAVRVDNEDDSGSGTKTTDLSASSANFTTGQALTLTHQQNSNLVAARASQALINVAQQMHDDYVAAVNSLSSKGPKMNVADSEWWNAFVQASDGAATVLKTFAPSMELNTNRALQDSSKVQGAALGSAITSTARIAASHFEPHAGGQLDEAMLGSFWDTLKGVAGTIGSVISTVAPVAAKIVPLLL